ncbi:hypothetical protein ACRTC3_19920 [Photobacterium damselae]|uniref:hypothetical protein n=1 Tax=Photobacterium damselae TaxID=38293 RepID=UPI003D7E5BAD
MSFSLYLKNKISKNKINRSDLIAQLNLYHDEFRNLDAITLSRWVNNKTTPSPYKQALISQYFGEDIITFINNHITIKKESKIIKNTFNSIMENIESSYSNISYFHSNEEPEYIVNAFDYNSYNSLLSNYYMNFPIYQKMNYIFDINNIKNDYLCVIKRKNNVISSHISSIKMDEKKSRLLSNLFKTNINSEFFVNLGYIENRESYLFMTSLLYYYFYKNNIRTFTCLIRGEFLEFLTLLSYQQIGTTYIDNGRKLYLIQGDFLNVITSPFVLRNFNALLSRSNNNLDDFFTTKLINS